MLPFSSSPCLFSQSAGTLIQFIQVSQAFQKYATH